MVHSGSAPPIPMTPPASLHLTVPVQAPPVQAPPPLIPPLSTPANQDQTQTRTEPLISALTSSLTPIRTLPLSPSQDEHPSSAQSLIRTPDASRVTLNGRSSGRKRTPKACDCCGPNSKGHNVKAQGRGRGRGRGHGRGRGRGRGRDLGDTQKRKMEGQLMRTNNLHRDSTEDDEDNEEDIDGEMVDTSPLEPVDSINIQSEFSDKLPVIASSKDGPIGPCVAPESLDGQKMEESAEAPGGDEVGFRWLGEVGRGVPAGRGMRARGRGTVKATASSKTEGNVGAKRGVGLMGVSGGGRVFGGSISAKLERVAPAESQSGCVLSTSPGLGREHGGAEGELGEGADSCLATFPSPSGSVDSLNPSGAGTLTGEQVETRCGEITLAFSGSVSRTEGPEAPILLDEPHDKMVPTLAHVSNGYGASPTDQNHTAMEVHPTITTPPAREVIAVQTTEHRWALRDHRLYCSPGTWQEEMQGEDEAMGTEGFSEETGRRHTDHLTGGGQKDNMDQLTDMVHEFLESFYMKYGSFIPLNETDIVEHLKTTGNSELSNRKLDIRREVCRYKAGLASAPVAGFMVTYNKHTLSLEDLSTLEEQNWLNDQVINMYGELIMEATQHKVHFFNSFFHKQLVAKGYEGVKRWTKKVDLFSKWLLLVPIHLEIHWSLISVDIATKTISYYDSQGIVFKHTIDNIMKYLQSEAREKKQPNFQKGWRMVIIKGIPQQKNDSDCGVFVLEYCRCLSRKRPLQFSQEDMPRIRKRLYKELCDCRLKD